MAREIPLTHGHVAIIDDEDVAWLTQWSWHCLDGYAVRTINHSKTRKERVRMHRLIARAAPDQLVDHINRNGLDNRRANLRCCTQAENSRNVSKGAGRSSSFLGVSWVQRDRVWTATIRRGRNHFLGYFDREEEAAIAHDIAARSMHGQFASLNFPEMTTYPQLSRRSAEPTSAFVGVYWHAQARKWAAAIKVDGRRKHLGLFGIEEEAARAYDAAARLHRGEFARLNFPSKETTA